MNKIVLSLLALSLISTAGCAELMESRQDYFEWRDSLGLPRQAAPSQQQVQMQQMQQQQMQQQIQQQIQIQQYGQPVYRAQDCIGSVVNGVCHGSTGAAQPRATCHGQMLNGQCTGPLF